MLAEGTTEDLLPGVVYNGGVYWSGGPPLDMLCMPILDETLIVPVGATDDELSGCTSSQGLATRRIGVQVCGC